jgi:hypothetical protein
VACLFITQFQLLSSTLQNPITDTWKKSVGPFCSLESLITDYTPLKPTKFKPKKKFNVLAGQVCLVIYAFKKLLRCIISLGLISDLVPTPQTKEILDSCLAHIPLPYKSD